MLRLGSGDTITIAAGGAAATTAPSVVTRYFQNGPKTAVASTNGTSAVTLVTGLAAPEVDVDTISVANIDTQANTVTVTATIGGVAVNFAVITMQAGDQFTVDTNGKITGINSAGQVLTQTTGGSTITFTTINAATATLAINGLAAAQGGAIVSTGGTSSTSANAGGANSVVGGTPGATGVGGAANLTGGIGGSTSGAGGNATVAGGAGTLNANGGNAIVAGGAKNGSGTNGIVQVGVTNTSAISIGATSIATTFAGPIIQGIGASTAAAGSTTSDAGALPAGTATVYPTTAADGTKGVVINSADKVTGRTLFIGNGVSNQTLKVYPASGGTINGGSADAAFVSVSGKGVIITCLSSGSNTWLAW